MNAEDLRTIEEAKRELRFLWLQGHVIHLDALEYDALEELMHQVEALHLRLTSREPQLTRASAVLSNAGQRCTIVGCENEQYYPLRYQRPGVLYDTYCQTHVHEFRPDWMATRFGPPDCFSVEEERAHAREIEGVCMSCGGRTINGRCNAGC